ncbi:VWA domain-containing protein [Gymnodinialimonas sp. 2305UL16-5]|uniref:vWA domain-containing protein n=1 Tax=Gymnodinialimonas mytili TaxID=3126503 RepID=UPI003095360E
MTSDTDLNDLKAAMDAATPAPDPVRKADVLARAQAAFDATQGSRTTARQTPVTPQKRGWIAGVIDMLKANTVGTLTGTTALVAIGFLVLSPTGQEILRGPDQVLRPEIHTGPYVAEEAGPADIADLPSTEVPLLAEPELRQETFTLSGEVGGPQDPSLDNGPRSGVTIPSDGSVQFGVAGGADTFADAEDRVLPNAPPSPAPVLGDIEITGGAEMGIAGGRANTETAILPGRRIAEDIVPPAPVTEEFANADANPLQIVAENPVSTFSSDVDTASYALVRSSLMQGQMPPTEAVRIEEMVNYFAYDLPAPDAEDISPFRPTISVFETPWNPDTQLLHIGIQGELPAIEDRPPLNLVLLVDTSGSMNDPAKLPLLIQSFRLMLAELRPEDEVAIVTYAGNAGVALDPTPASETRAIADALTALQAGGSTNGVGGLEEAYRLAADMTDEGEVSRVLLATDGDFNVGINDPAALEDYIAAQRETGIYLSVLGFGRGNLQDDTMQALAQNGNGTATFIDTLHEARRVLVDQLVGALFPIADDLKVQVEFNPEVIAEYRLIGYETRGLAREDFANDAVDAGELGAGHSVTAIYEVTPVGSPATLVAPLRYAADETGETEFANELGYLSLRWKEPGAEDSQLVDFAIPAAASDPSPEAGFAAAIAGFGQLLRGSGFLGDWDYADAIALANANRGEDRFGSRQEAVQLMRLAESLAQQ